MLRTALLFVLVATVAAAPRTGVAAELDKLLKEAAVLNLVRLVPLGGLILQLGKNLFIKAFTVYLKSEIRKATENLNNRGAKRAFRAQMRLKRHINWHKFIDEDLTPAEFRGAYGVARGTFESILQNIRHLIVKPVGWGGVRNSNVMLPEIKLAITLRWLRGGSYRDLMPLYGCAPTTFYNTAYAVCEAICVTYYLELHGAVSDFMVHADGTRLKAIAAGFGRHSGGIIGNAIGAIDGVQIAIKKPSLKEVPNPTAYYNRKGWFAINVQAIADSTGRIIWASIKAPGAMHDSGAFEITDFHRTISYGISPYHLVGDDAYSNSHMMLCPIPGVLAPGSKEDAFNYYQSLTRISVERGTPTRARPTPVIRPSPLLSAPSSPSTLMHSFRYDPAPIWHPPAPPRGAHPQRQAHPHDDLPPPQPRDGRRRPPPHRRHRRWRLCYPTHDCPCCRWALGAFRAAQPDR